MREVRQKEARRYGASRDHAEAMLADPFAENKEEARDQEESRRRVEYRV